MTALLTSFSNCIKTRFRWNRAQSGSRDRDIEILDAFITTYCRHHHTAEPDDTLCPDCRRLLRYAEARRKNCPYDPKPACKNCTTHCYAQRYRGQIKEVMKFSGMHYIKRGRIDWLLKYFMQ